jgi:hypothetical protein
MSMSFHPNPSISASRLADEGSPALTPHRGRDTYSELPKSDSAPIERRIAGEAQPGADALTQRPSHAGRWRRVAQMFLDYPGEAFVALLLVSWVIWMDDLLMLLIRWSS